MRKNHIKGVSAAKCSTRVLVQNTKKFSKSVAMGENLGSPSKFGIWNRDIHKLKIDIYIGFSKEL